MRVVVAAVGRPRDHAIADAIRDYESRARRYWTLEVHEVREEPARGLSADVVRKREGNRLADRLPDGIHLVACDAGGSTMTSDSFAAWLGRERDGGRDIAFTIGGAYGLAPALRDRANRRLALAAWTLPHELARLVLAEQLYRAGTILRGEPYHK